ncbi:MAG: ATP cone domain-containing protein, partial [Nitrososphaeraceae archaeon]|nr:ATP cone domain-containing protein [Nitrososphaeraceae archaeon]
MAKEITEIENSSNDNKKPIAQIKKRDKGLVDFNNSKISNAIYKALMAAGKADYKLAERLSEKVVQKMDQQFSVLDT